MISPDANPGVYLQLSACDALYGAIGPNLVRLTGEFRGNTVFLQWVVLEEATEDEMEDYSCASAKIIAAYYDAMLEEEYIRVREVANAEAVEPLSLQLFSRNLRSRY